MMMTGTSPYISNQSSSFHSSSYIPRLEASFMRDFICCDRTWPTLHDLLQHYEENHHPTTAAPAASRDAFGASQANSRATSRAGSVAPTTGRPQQPSQSMHGFPQQRQVGAGLGVGGIGQMMRQQQHQAAPSQKVNSLSHMNDEMDAVGDMELDETVGPMDMDDNTRTIQQTRQLFGQQQRPQLHLNSSGLPHQALRTSQPPTPAAVSFGFQNNPTVSSVNTPTLTTQQGLPQRGQQFGQDGNGDEEDEIPGMPMKMNLGNMNLGGSQLGGLAFGALGTIDDPAKRLFSPGGTTQMTSQQRALDQQMQLQQQLQQHLQAMNLDLSQFPAGTDPALILQQMTALMMPPAEEHKPFRCPVIGCEKAYKNQNGLK
jgi:transcription factor SFP1